MRSRLPVEHIRNIQINLRVSSRMKQQMTALAKTQNISRTELIARALDAYASPDVNGRLDNSKHIDFSTRHHELLRITAKHLPITLADAVEYALEFGLVNLARGAWFFAKNH